MEETPEGLAFAAATREAAKEKKRLLELEVSQKHLDHCSPKSIVRLPTLSPFFIYDLLLEYVHLNPPA